MLEEDETLARMLQQQLLEEEQRMQRRTANYASSGNSHLTQQELDDMELARQMAQMDFEQHRRSTREDHLARARRLQEEAFSNVSSAASSSHHQVPTSSSSSSSQTQRALLPPPPAAATSAARGVDEQLAYARSLQEQAFSNVVAAQHKNSSASARAGPRTTEESDLELAMRMQEMEEMGLSSSRASGLALDSSESHRHRSFSTNDISLQSRLQQEEEDARLARLMEGGGPSLRELQSQISGHHRNYDNNNINVESAPQSSSSMSAAAGMMPTNSAPIPVSSVPRKPPPTMESQMATGGGFKPPPPAPVPPPPVRPSNLSSYTPVVNMPPSIATTLNSSSHNNQHHSSNSSAHSRTPSVNTYPTAVPRPFPPMHANPYPAEGLVNTDPPGIAMPNEAAFLDVPGNGATPNNDREKRRGGGFFGLFRRSPAGSSGQTVASNSARDNNSKRGSRRSSAQAINPPNRNGPSNQRNKPPRLASLPPVAIPAPIPPPPPTELTQTGPLPHSISVSQTIGRNEATAQRKGALATCCNCKKLSTNLIVALDKKYHPECLRCVACYQNIDATQPFAFVTDGHGEKQPLHRQCYAGLYGVKCAVCKQSIPAGEDGKVSFVKHPFFDTEQMCPRHASNPGRRCTGCHRFEPEDEPFADLNDSGRCVCFACCRSVVVDSDEATVLWNKVVDFFERLGLPIWKDMRQVPILIVGYDALNNQIARAGGSHGNSTQIMTRGLCLTEHESGKKIKLSTLRWNKNNFSFEACDAELKGFTYFQVPDASKVNPDASVTAILCLSGLPSDLVASVLAHEATHAWIKLHPRFDIANPIPPQVEEGCAQLLALLFLNDGLEPASRATLDVEGPTDEKLRQYFKFSIETDDNEIYGEGYRKAAAAYANIGIEALMSHVVLYQEFPRT